MNGVTKTAIAAVLALTMSGTLMAADRSNTLALQETCEDAVRAELSDGDARIKRVRVTDSEDSASFWLTVRHKNATAAKSTRYRVLCTFDKSDAETALSIDEGWWQKGRRGQAPIAVD